METEIGLRLAPWLVLAAIPLILASATAFTKVSVVLGALRMGLGAQQLIPYGALGALALLLTAIVMAPTGLAMAATVADAGGLEALLAGPVEGWSPVLGPLKEFVLRHADPKELAFYGELNGADERALLVAVPAFLTSELTTALEMAVVILVPFLIVDLLVAQVLVLVGFGPGAQPLVSLPLKILLFLGVGGWDIVIGGLVGGYS